MLTERKRRFADAYIRLANATRAAIEAGYSSKGNSAASNGCRLLNDVDVLTYIDARRVKRDVHADVTYGHLVTTANVAMEELKNARDAIPKDPERLRGALREAVRCLVALGKAEGLFIERLQVSGEIGIARRSLQDLVRAVGESHEKQEDPLTSPRRFGAGALDGA